MVADNFTALVEILQPLALRTMLIQQQVARTCTVTPFISAAGASSKLCAARLWLLQSARMSNANSHSGHSYEIERKFALCSSTKARLLSVARRSAAKVCEESLTDLYFDDERYTLTLSDRWLRQRDHVWQLKQPVTSKSFVADDKPRYSDTTVYEEIVGANEVRKALAWKYSLEDERELRVFASLRTYRMFFSIPWMGFDCLHIVLDECEAVVDDQATFCHCVGEVEICEDDPSSIPRAQEAINAFCEKNGLLGQGQNSESPGEGKLVQYLRTCSPRHYSLLLEAGVI